MANAGDNYTVELKEAHLGWGTYRHTNSRPLIPEECYLPIPRNEAVRLSLLNSNGTSGMDILGKNIFHCTSVDGLFDAMLKAQGCSQGKDPYAKQFSVDNDLRALNTWYDHVGAKPGDKVRVTWNSPTELVIELL